MKRFFIACIAALAGYASAATHYIRDGGTASTAGAGSCTGWATANACDQLPATLVRGDTYCVADGTYPGRTIDTAESSTTLITIRKAVHGDGTCDQGANWVSTYGDGQAEFTSGILIGSSYWTIDGAVRNETTWRSGYGFRFTTIEANSSFTSTCPDSITFRYIDAGGPAGATLTGSEPDTAIQASCFIGGQLNNNWTIHRSFLHNIAHFATVLYSSMDGALIEYTMFADGWGKEAVRGQFVSKNIIIRYNRFEDACGTASPDACTADIAMWSGDNAGDHDGNEVYGNTFYQSNTNGHNLNTGASIVIGGNGSSWVGAGASNTKIYNNSFTGFHNTGQHGHILINGGSNNECRNNLWFNVDNPTASCTTTSNNVNAGSNPFASLPGMALSAATAAGATLSAPYNVDMTGTTRGADGTWDLGALEFVAGGTPNAPQNLRIASWIGWLLVGGLLGLMFRRREQFLGVN